MTTNQNQFAVDTDLLSAQHVFVDRSMMVFSFPAGTIRWVLRVKRQAFLGICFFAELVLRRLEYRAAGVQTEWNWHIDLQQTIFNAIEPYESCMSFP